MRAYKEKKLGEGKASQLVTNNMINKLIRVVSTMVESGGSSTTPSMYRRSHKKQP